MKKCSKCGEIKDKSEFYKDNRNLDKLRYRCKKCNIYKYYPVSGITEKECYDCNKTKSLSEYNISWSGKYGRSPYCKPCYSIRTQDYRKSAKWRKLNTENQRRYRKNNPNKALEQDGYIANTMRSKERNITKEDITPEMIKIQRKYLKLKRKVLTIKNNKKGG